MIIRYFTPVYGLIGTIGFLYCLYDLIKNDRPNKILWGIGLFFIPFAFIVYLLLLPSLDNNKASNLTRQKSKNVTQVSKSTQTFRTVGAVLGFIAIIGGVAVVGFFILFMMAMSSYGSNK